MLLRVDSEDSDQTGQKTKADLSIYCTCVMCHSDNFVSDWPI